jgi:hypothetical protein
MFARNVHLQLRFAVTMSGFGSLPRALGLAIDSQRREETPTSSPSTPSSCRSWSTPSPARPDFVFPHVCAPGCKAPAPRA